jgi:hypothetical protein
VSEDSALPKKTVTYFSWYMKLAGNITQFFADGPPLPSRHTLTSDKALYVPFGAVAGDAESQAMRYIAGLIRSQAGAERRSGTGYARISTRSGWRQGQ